MIYSSKQQEKILFAKPPISERVEQVQNKLASILTQSLVNKNKDANDKLVSSNNG